MYTNSSLGVGGKRSLKPRHRTEPVSVKNRYDRVKQLKRLKQCALHKICQLDVQKEHQPNHQVMPAGTRNSRPGAAAELDFVA